MLFNMILEKLFSFSAQTRSFVYLIIGAIIISWLIPFPFSFLIILGVVSLALLSLREKVMSIIGLAKLIAKTFSNRNNSADYYYYCISCGIKHSEISCPKCGSGFKYSIGGRQKRK
jgi:asparagine N-glycosylation enzyme membrane subunit Stt3